MAFGYEDKQILDIIKASGLQKHAVLKKGSPQKVITTKSINGINIICNQFEMTNHIITDTGQAKQNIFLTKSCSGQ